MNLNFRPGHKNVKPKIEYKTFRKNSALNIVSTGSYRVCNMFVKDYFKVTEDIILIQTVCLKN